MRPDTLATRRRLYVLARVLVARYFDRRLTLPVVARALACSPRQLQRAYAQFSDVSFSEELRARRMAAAAELLRSAQSTPVSEVARRVGYREPSHFAHAFGRHHGLSPTLFRERSAKAPDVHGPRPCPPERSLPEPMQSLAAPRLRGSRLRG